MLSLELEVHFEEIFHPDLSHIVDNVPGKRSRVRDNSLLGVSPYLIEGYPNTMSTVRGKSP